MYSCRRDLDPPQFPRDILTGVDRAQTVFLTRPGACADQYQQPLQWILSLHMGQKVGKQLLIISLYEANQLLPHIQSSTAVFLHLYGPCFNLAWPADNHLQPYTVRTNLPEDWVLPRRVRLRLNIFAGQLNFGL